MGNSLNPLNRFASMNVLPRFGRALSSSSTPAVSNAATDQEKTSPSPSPPSRTGTDEGLVVEEKIAVLAEPAEQALALILTRFGEVVAEVADTLQPHRLCGYLYELAGALSVFYEQCPVLKSDGEIRASRLALCTLTKKVLASGLDMLGIEALERM